MPPLPSFMDHPLEKLEEALALRKQIAALQERLSNLFGSEEDAGTAQPAPKAAAGTSKGGGTSTGGARKSLKGRTLSPKVRARMAAAQKARYEKARGEKPASSAKPAPGTSQSKTVGPGTAGGGGAAAATPSSKKKGELTPEGRAKLSAAMKARWAARKKGAPAPNAKAANGSAKK